MVRTQDGCLLPVAHHHFDVSVVKFCDALALRYNKPLVRMPESCDGCKDSFTLCHALDCWKGGLVMQRHNEVRDVLGDIAAMVHTDVIREPVVREPQKTK